jgi:hypothetical protein
MEAKSEAMVDSLLRTVVASPEDNGAVREQQLVLEASTLIWSFFA